MVLFDSFGRRPPDDIAGGMNGRQRVTPMGSFPGYGSAVVEHEGGTTVYSSWQECESAKHLAADARRFRKTHAYAMDIKILCWAPMVLKMKLKQFWQEHRQHSETWSDFLRNWLNHDPEGQQYRGTEEKIPAGIPVI